MKKSQKLLPLNILFTCGLLFFHFALIAQSDRCELVGKVIEKTSGNTIIGAVITIPGTSYGAVSEIGRAHV